MNKNAVLIVLIESSILLALAGVSGAIYKYGYMGWINGQASLEKN